MPDDDIKYMKRCFTLARKGAGKVSPNPLVGCVIVKNGRIISEGWHEAYGKAHAEAMAIKNTTESLQGATLYCNLEPCCHTNKKTPPCLPLVIEAGVKRVVLSNMDPNPQVSGRSIKQMREAGIEVVENILTDQGKEFNRFFFKFVMQKGPWVTLKIAQTSNACIATEHETQKWITGNRSRRYVHRLRAQHDAVLIGAGTVSADNPRLDVRFGRGRNPLRLVLDGRLNSNPQADIYSGEIAGETWLLHSASVAAGKKKVFEVKKVRLVGLDSNGYELDLQKVLDFLTREKVSSILVEGGQGIFSSFLNNSLTDEIVIIQAATLWQNGVHSMYVQKDMDFNLIDCKKSENDVIMRFKSIGKKLQKR